MIRPILIVKIPDEIYTAVVDDIIKGLQAFEAEYIFLVVSSPVVKEILFEYPINSKQAISPKLIKTMRTTLPARLI